MKVAGERVPRGTAEGIEAREDERRWLARELHDGPAQSLAAALFGVDLAIAALQRGPQAARDELRAARELVRDALDDVRALMAGLRPRQLEEQGLVGALEALCGSLPLWGPEIRLDTQGVTNRHRVPAEIELAVYRIAQEALSNARRHAKARQVVVTLAIDARSVSLVVTDDGCGFVPGEARPATGGEGLRGMRERAERLGGVFELESVPGKGTRVSVVVPLPRRDNGIGAGKGDE